ncbi:hypothetical protein P8X24_11605 [Pyrococcus kukulkanii]|uniref:hypothetical protein n=1 Tax=Pyrococcus kukulkanii TaxID=1609559 RepID=UPI0035685EA2
MKLLRFLIIGILGIIVLSSGCIKEEGGALLIDLGNQTLTIPLNQTTNTTTTSTPVTYTYERKVEAGYELVIQELNVTIKVDYEVREGKFVFFVTYNNQTNHYYEPMDITINDVEIHGEGYWVGTSLYIAQIVIESPYELTVFVREVSQ